MDHALYYDQYRRRGRDGDNRYWDPETLGKYVPTGLPMGGGKMVPLNRAKDCLDVMSPLMAMVRGQGLDSPEEVTGRLKKSAYGAFSSKTGESGFHVNPILHDVELYNAVRATFVARNAPVLPAAQIHQEAVDEVWTRLSTDGRSFFDANMDLLPPQYYEIVRYAGRYRRAVRLLLGPINADRITKCLKTGWESATRMGPMRLPSDELNIERDYLSNAEEPVHALYKHEVATFVYMVPQDEKEAANVHKWLGDEDNRRILERLFPELQSSSKDSSQNRQNPFESIDKISLMMDAIKTSMGSHLERVTDDRRRRAYPLAYLAGRRVYVFVRLRAYFSTLTRLTAIHPVGVTPQSTTNGYVPSEKVIEVVPNVIHSLYIVLPDPKVVDEDLAKAPGATTSPTEPPTAAFAPLKKGVITPPTDWASSLVLRTWRPLGGFVSPMEALSQQYPKLRGLWEAFRQNRVQAHIDRLPSTPEFPRDKEAALHCDMTALNAYIESEGRALDEACLDLTGSYYEGRASTFPRTVAGSYEHTSYGHASHIVGTASIPLHSVVLVLDRPRPGSLSATAGPSSGRTHRLACVATVDPATSETVTEFQLATTAQHVEGEVADRKKLEECARKKKMPPFLDEKVLQAAEKDLFIYLFPYSTRPQGNENKQKEMKLRAFVPYKR